MSRDPTALLLTPEEWEALGYEGEDSDSYTEFPVNLWIVDKDGEIGVGDPPAGMSLHVGLITPYDEDAPEDNEPWVWGKLDANVLFEELLSVYEDSPKYAAFAVAFLRGWADRIEKAAVDTGTLQASQSNPPSPGVTRSP